MYITNVLDLIGNTPLVSLEATTGLHKEQDQQHFTE